MNRSRNEIDFIRLLRQCEILSSAEKRNWRFEKFVDALNEKLDCVRSQTANVPLRDTLEEYGRKVQYLRGLIETEKLPSAEKRLLATELFGPDRDEEETSCDFRYRSNSDYKDSNKQINKSNQMREYLLSPRKRGKLKTRKEVRNVEEDGINESVTEELLRLAKSIREHHTVANASIKKDIEVLSQVSSNADLLSSKMKQSNDKLEDFVRKSGQFGAILLLIFVTFSFFFMVIFIRLNPKKI